MLGWVMSFIWAGLAWASSEVVLKEEAGFVICTGGGTQAALFSRDCQKITLHRITSGSIKYEGNCLDSNGVTYFMACDAISFEHSRKLPTQHKTFWDQNKDTSKDP